MLEHSHAPTASILRFERSQPVFLNQCGEVFGFSLSATTWRNVMRAMRAASAVLFCLFLSVQSFAQTSNATLGGTVSDATGALIPGVSITATNTATGIVNTVTTNEAGAYQFPNLQTGTYNVTAG